MTENPVFRLRDDALSNANNGDIGNSNLKEEIDNMSALNLQKDTLGIKNSNLLEVPIPGGGIDRSAVSRKTGLDMH